MKIILTYPDDLGKETEDAIVEWAKDWIDRSFQVSNPFRYVVKLEVDR